MTPITVKWFNADGLQQGQAEFPNTGDGHQSALEFALKKSWEMNLATLVMPEVCKLMAFRDGQAVIPGRDNTEPTHEWTK